MDFFVSHYNFKKIIFKDYSMPVIHFFPGGAFCSLVDKQHIYSNILQAAFKQIKNSNTQPSYAAFDDLMIYTSSDQFKQSHYHENDIIVAASAGGNLAKQFIISNQINNPAIVAFEAESMMNYQTDVWQFVSWKGRGYGSSKEITFFWDDTGIGHNSYMLHPIKDKIITKSKDPILLHKESHGEVFYLFNQITILNSETQAQKVLSNVILRCDASGNWLNQKNPNDSASMLMDMMVNIAYAKLKDDETLLPAGFNALLSQKFWEKKRVNEFQNEIVHEYMFPYPRKR